MESISSLSRGRLFQSTLRIGERFSRGLDVEDSRTPTAYAARDILLGRGRSKDGELRGALGEVGGALASFRNLLREYKAVKDRLGATASDEERQALTAEAGALEIELQRIRESDAFGRASMLSDSIVKAGGNGTLSLSQASLLRGALASLRYGSDLSLEELDSFASAALTALSGPSPEDTATVRTVTTGEGKDLEGIGPLEMQFVLGEEIALSLKTYPPEDLIKVAMSGLNIPLDQLSHLLLHVPEKKVDEDETVEGAPGQPEKRQRFNRVAQSEDEEAFP